MNKEYREYCERNTKSKLDKPYVMTKKENKTLKCQISAQS